MWEPEVVILWDEVYSGGVCIGGVAEAVAAAVVAAVKYCAKSCRGTKFCGG